MNVSLLRLTGMTELAMGALSGWVYTAVKKQPSLMRRLGVVAPDRVRQTHLDLAMLGAFTVVCDLAVPQAPKPFQLALGIGAWTNALAFAPLAVKPDLETKAVFLVPTVVSFVFTSVGFSGMAATTAARYLASRDS